MQLQTPIAPVSEMTRGFDIDWWPNDIVFAPGAVDRLPALLAGVGRQRAFVVCGKSIASGSALDRVRAALGRAYAGAFTEIEMHAPLPVLERAAQAACAADADCIVSVGGGSAIDSGKGIALIDTVGADYRAYAMSTMKKPLPDLRMVHIAIPTTTGSGSEVAPTCGLRDPQAGKKVIFRGTQLIPTVAILDPEITLATPKRLTAASGMTAVARCIESMYAGRRNPVHGALALHGLRLLAASLPRSIEAPDDIEARSQCLVASAMSAIAANANVSAVHAIGHIVGGKYGLQHGIAHSILLAPTMRVMLPSIGSMQIPLLEALGSSSLGMNASEAGQTAADLVARLVEKLPLPQRLRDVGVQKADIPALAEHAAHDPIMLASAAPIAADRLIALLESAW